MSTLKREDFLKLSTEELKKIVADPDKLSEVNAMLAEPSEPVDPVAPVADPPTPTPDDAAKIEADRVAAEAAELEADKTAAKLAEQEAYKAAGLTVETDSAGNITKIIKTYQARDESGNPIGRPTYLEAKNWAELSVKQQNAHEHAVRFGERVKKQQITKKADVAPVQTLSDAELQKLQDELKSEDRDVAAKAAEQVRRNDEAKKFAEADKAIEGARQARVSYAFLTKHVNDFNSCQANNKLLSDYIHDNKLEWTEDNLEAALIAVESQLAEKEQPAPVVPANPVPVTPAPVVPPPATVATPVPPAVPNNPAPPAARPGVNGGLIPGDQSAPRPYCQPKGLTKEDVQKMSREEFRRRMKDPKFLAEFNALKIRNGLRQS